MNEMNIDEKGTNGSCLFFPCTFIQGGALNLADMWQESPRDE
jgi:hypothetical protein